MVCYIILYLCAGLFVLLITGNTVFHQPINSIDDITDSEVNISITVIFLWPLILLLYVGWVLLRFINTIIRGLYLFIQKLKTSK